MAQYPEGGRRGPGHSRWGRSDAVRNEAMAAVTVRRPALRYHGGKFRLAAWIMAHFPDHRCYVEPFGGGAGVLLQKPRAFAEIYNDLDGDVVNYFEVLRDP